MALYRAEPKDGVAWVTGASTGMGRQLALDLARAGWTVAATARGEEKLTALSNEATTTSGRIAPFPCDVTDADAMAATVAEIGAALGPIALAVFNAGSYFPTHGAALSVKNFAYTYDVNLMGVVHGLVPAVHAMQARGRGQVVIIGSVTSYFGLPAAAAYGSSKAALNNMAESLRHDLDKMNIRIQVMNPGFIDTPATEKNEFSMPALMPVEKASARIVEGMRSGGFEVTFPRRFTWFLKLLRLLPHPVVHFVLNRATGWNTRPLDSR